MGNELTTEDAKLVTLAKGARSRIDAAEAAAVRDNMGRSYSGASVSTGEFRLSAIQLAVAQALAAGAKGLELAVVLGVEKVDLELLRAFAGIGVPVLRCSVSGEILERFST
ncbi:MAG: cytidine deaminase [Candidatus Nanopelagicales bacterium]|nr:cytidine deaminase [Candidatus Nanopelagicales bacterium]